MDTSRFYELVAEYLSTRERDSWSGIELQLSSLLESRLPISTVEEYCADCIQIILEYDRSKGDESSGLE